MQYQTGSRESKTMTGSASAFLLLLAWLSASVTALANDDQASGRKDEPVVRQSSTAMETPQSWDVTLSDGTYGGRMGRLPANVKVQRYIIDESGRQGKVDSFDLRTGLKEIYSNTNSIEPLPGGGFVGFVWHHPDAPQRVADDMRTQAITPCELGEIRVDVHGGNLDADADAQTYSVTLQLWDGCPNDGGSVIELPPTPEHPTGNAITYNDLVDNELSILTIPVLPGTVPPSSTIWVSANFPANDPPFDPLHVGAGFIVGSPPEKGFSQDGVDTPRFPCTANFGGWPSSPHASIAAKVFAEGACETHFFAYMAVNNPKDTFSIGRNIRHAEDLTLTVDNCELSSYEIGIIGQARGFLLKADLRTGPFFGLNAHPHDLIPGTEGVYVGRGLGEVEVARFEFPPGIRIPQEVWVTWSINQSRTGVILTQDTQVGTGSDLYAYETPDVGRCTITQDPCRTDEDCHLGLESCSFWTGENFPGPDTGIFYVSVNCRGETPTGACCRVPDETSGVGGVCADNVTAAGCPQGRWARDESCSPDPFFPACGTAACCFENSAGGSDCDHLTKADCDVRSDCSHSGCVNQPGVWQPGDFCTDDDFRCFYFACFFANEPEADCLAEHPAELTCGNTFGVPSDDECRPSEGWHWGCDWSGTCTGSGDPCHVDGPETCAPSGGCPVARDCHPSSDCPPGECCATQFSIGRCNYPLGCNDIRCCDEVCSNSPLGCCDPGSGWMFWCTEYAQNNCPIPPKNDECFDPDDLTQGAEIIEMAPDGSGGWEGFRSVNNLGLASWNIIPPYNDPPVCCNNLGVDAPGAVSEWFLVEAKDTSILVSTCTSSGQLGQDSMIQVMMPDDRGTAQTECRSLVRRGCNDDAGCGHDGRMSEVCVQGLTASEPVYIQLSTPSITNAFEKTYLLTIQQPCPDGSQPSYTRCLGAKSVPTGAAEVPFGCPGGDGVCLQDTTLVCEGLDPDEECFAAMKNDVWIEYTPACTGVLSINSCEPAPLTSPETTLAVYGATTDFGHPCPIERGFLLDCNDDADVNAEQHALRPQECTLGRNPCESDDDCALIDETCENSQCVTICGGPGTCPHVGQVCVKACSLSGDPCEISAECPGGETCYWDHCARPCDTDGNCTLAACSTGGNLCDDNNDCDVGICSWGQDTVCDVSMGLNACSDVCRQVPGIECDPLADPGEPGSCPAGYGPCIPQTCIRTETCIGEVCESSCWPGSTVKLPVSDARSYRVRLGGEFGSEPEGSLKFDCEPQDCNLDKVPDICNADCDAMDGACGQWFLLCGSTQECHSANKRCTVGGFYDLTGAPCVDHSDCAACSVSGAACLDDDDCPVGETCDPTGETCSSKFNTFDVRYGRIDVCDIGFGDSVDCDPIGPAGRNRIPDECEIRDDPALDIFPPPNGNGILDDCEDFTSICGDGSVTGSETCDDGALNGTGEGHCLADCSGIQVCGDGNANGTEVCDDGGSNGTGEGHCLADCSGIQTCGDGNADGTEVCDHGALNGTGEGHCLADCSGIQTCGDGNANGTEVCDDGTSNGAGEGYCLADCSAVQACGDGVANGTEACDGLDNAACAGRPCSGNCTCAPPTCGDGIRDVGEACDGNDDELCRGLGCRVDCTCRLPKPRTPKPREVTTTRVGPAPGAPPSPKVGAG